MPQATAPDTVRSRARDEDGSYLIEIIVSALILVIVAVGVLKSLDRGTALGAEQQLQAVAGNVAHAELEQVRALPVSEVSNLRRVATRTIGAVTYTATTRADWINDARGDTSCTTAGSRADYMKLSTTVTWPRMGTRKAVKLESLLTPGVRAFGSDQGSLAVRITDRNGAGFGGLQLDLSGGATLSDVTSAAGCVLWGYLGAGSSYTLGFSLAGYVLTDGSQVASVPVSVVGGTTSNVALQYDRGGRLSTKFMTKRDSVSGLTPTSPKRVHATHAGGVSVAFDATANQATSALLFPFTSAYTVYADSCSASEVPSGVVAARPVSVGVASVVPGQTTPTPGLSTPEGYIRLPALNIAVVDDDLPVQGAAIRVTTPCGTVYDRTTTDDGQIDDPGFPYASSLAICVSDGTRRVKTTSSNTDYTEQTVLVDMSTATLTGPC